MSEITLYELGSYNAGKLVPHTFDLDLIDTESEWREAISEWLNELNGERIEKLVEEGKAPDDALTDENIRNNILSSLGMLAEEWIVCDYAEIPRNYVGEWDINPEYWAYKTTLEKSHLDPEIFNAGVSLGIPVDKIEEAYAGSFRSDEDFAMSLAEDIGAIDEKAAWPHDCIDWERAARDLMYDYNEKNGHYFRNDW